MVGQWCKYAFDGGVKDGNGEEFVAVLKVTFLWKIYVNKAMPEFHLTLRI